MLTLDLPGPLLQVSKLRQHTTYHLAEGKKISSMSASTALLAGSKSVLPKIRVIKKETNSTDKEPPPERPMDKTVEYFLDWWLIKTQLN